MNARTSSSISRTISALSLVAALCLVAAAPAHAAKPPADRTYLTVFVGLDDQYELFQECLVFTDDEVCDIDGELCGAWWPTESTAGQGGFAFELSFTDDVGLTLINGHARIDHRGPPSSLGGAGLVETDGVKSSFSLAARQTAPGACEDLLDQPAGPEPSGDSVVSESRSVASFNEVSLTGAGRLIIEHTGSESLTITAEPYILPLLTSEVRDGRLILGSVPDAFISTRHEIVFRLTVATLDSITVAGAGWVEIRGIDTEVLEVDISGAAVIEADGSVDRQRVRIAGAGIYRAPELRSRIATIHVTGAAKALIRVSEELNGSVSGLGVIKYIGEPRVDVAISGLGQVRQEGR